MGIRANRTAKKKREFLQQVANGSKGNISHACDVVGLPRQTLYDALNRSEGFRKKVEAAVEQGVDAAEDEAHRRGALGYEESIVYQGKIQKVGRGKNSKPATVLRYSDYLLARYMAAKRASWRNNRTEITGADGDPLQQNAIIVLPSNGKGAGEASGE